MPTTRKISGYGWLPDLPDHRDLLYAPPPDTQRQLPPSASVRDAMPPVFDQGHLGSCTGNAIAAADEFEAVKQGEDFGTPKPPLHLLRRARDRGHGRPGLGGDDQGR